MDITILLSFLGASVLLTIMPGPDITFVLTESLTKGQRNGIGISLGLCLGVVVHTTAAATGLSIIILQSQLMFSAIKYLGAVYLFYLAYQSAKEEKTNMSLDTHKMADATPFFSLVRKGFLMNVLNPKVSLFFIAFLPQFVTQDGIHSTIQSTMHPTIQMMILGLVFMIQALLIFSSISVLSGRLSIYLNSSKFWEITKWVKVSVLLILGITLLFAFK